MYKYFGNPFYFKQIFLNAIILKCNILLKIINIVFIDYFKLKSEKFSKVTI